jgi:hypothetical protein
MYACLTLPPLSIQVNVGHNGRDVTARNIATTLRPNMQGRTVGKGLLAQFKLREKSLKFAINSNIKELKTRMISR